MATLLNQAKTKTLKARAGLIDSIKLAGFKVGTAKQYTPTATQTDLKSAILIGDAYIKAFTSVTQVDALTYTYECTLTENECTGSQITELALVDTDGDAVCIKTFPAKYKEEDKVMTFKINDTWEDS